MGGPGRGAIGLADTKARMVRGWGPTKSLSAEDGSRRLQMGPVSGGKRSGTCPALPAAPLHPSTRHPHKGNSATHTPVIILFALMPHPSLPGP